MNHLPTALRYFLAVASVLSLSLLLYALRQYVGPDLAPSAPLLLLFVVFLAAIQVGLGPALLAAMVAGLCYNFFFLLPYYTFTIGRLEDVVAFTVFFAVAVVASRLAAQAAGRAQEPLAERPVDSQRATRIICQAK